ncbi:MAG: YfgM family protein [Succinivibrio sp.]
MDVLTDDHEREQVVRKWWHDNWLSLTVGVVIAVGGMAGYRYYQSAQNEKACANAYELSTIQTKLNLTPESAKGDALKFIDEHKDIYGSLLSLDLAALNAREGKYDDAIGNATFAIENGGDIVSPNATLVKARILTQQGKTDEAVSSLEAIKGDAYQVEKNELLGDIYLSKGDKAKAHDAYKAALDICEKQKISINPVLQVKFDSLIAKGDTPAFERAAKLQQEIARSASEIKK